MRNSGIHLFHAWRVFPSSADAQGNLTFTARIDGRDVGRLMSQTLPDAIVEVKLLIAEMLEEKQC